MVDVIEDDAVEARTAGSRAPSNSETKFTERLT